MKRFERIGLTRHWVDIVERSVRSAERLLSGDASARFDGIWHQSLVERFHTAAIGSYLNDDVSATSRYARLHIDATREYFFGDWRRTPRGPEPEYWQNGDGWWIAEYRAGVAFASSFGDIEAIQELSRFPERRKYDGSSFATQTAWYLALSEVLVRGDSPRLRDMLDDLLKGQHKVNKACSALLRSVLDGNARATESGLDTYMKYHIGTERKRDEISVKLAIDGTILFHLAKRLGQKTDFWTPFIDHFIILGDSDNRKGNQESGPQVGVNS